MKLLAKIKKVAVIKDAWLLCVVDQVAFVAKKGWPHLAHYKVGPYGGTSVEIGFMIHGKYGQHQFLYFINTDLQLC